MAPGFWLLVGFLCYSSGLWEMWETRVAERGAFPKSCGKARLHRGFPQDVRFHSPVLGWADIAFEARSVC